jgi:hypothetical protein
MPNNILVIPGLPRCATTSLVNVLSQHPMIFVGVQKEPHYFLPEEVKFKSYSLDSNGNRVSFNKLGFCQSLNEYEENYKTLNHSNDGWFIDGSTLYSSHPDSIRVISTSYAKNRNLKFIVAFRESLNRAKSHYSFSLSRGEEYLGFHEALKAERNGVRNNWILNGYLEGGRISPVVEEIVDNFGIESLFLFDLDQVSIFSQDFMDDLCLFLNVNPQKFDFDVYQNGGEIPKGKILKSIRVAMRRVRQLNPRVFDNKFTRYFFNKFMQRIPKEEKGPQQEISEELVYLFNRIDQENSEVFKKYKSGKLNA